MKKGKDDPIYKFICKFWKWIKSTEIPDQSNQPAWDKIVDDATELTRAYLTDKPIDRLFRMWVIAYLEYMGQVSSGKSIVDEQVKKIERSA